MSPDSAPASGSPSEARTETWRFPGTEEQAAHRRGTGAHEVGEAPSCISLNRQRLCVVVIECASENRTHSVRGDATLRGRAVPCHWRAREPFGPGKVSTRSLLNFSGDGQDAHGSKLSSAHRIETMLMAQSESRRLRGGRAVRIVWECLEPDRQRRGAEPLEAEAAHSESRSRASSRESPASCGCRSPVKRRAAVAGVYPVNVRNRGGLGQGTRETGERGIQRRDLEWLGLLQGQRLGDHVREGPVGLRLALGSVRVPWHCRPPTVLWLPGAIDRPAWVENRPRPGRKPRVPAPAGFAPAPDQRSSRCTRSRHRRRRAGAGLIDRVPGSTIRRHAWAGAPRAMSRPAAPRPWSGADAGRGCRLPGDAIAGACAGSGADCSRSQARSRRGPAVAARAGRLDSESRSVPRSPGTTRGR